MSFAVVSGAIVGAIVCVAGAMAIRSLAWLYRQLRKRTRHDMDIQLSVMTASTAAEGRTERRRRSQPHWQYYHQCEPYDQPTADTDDDYGLDGRCGGNAASRVG